MATPQRIPMTREGFEKLKKELETLRSTERPKVVTELEEARAHGDLSENAEYHAAREKLGHVDGRIQDLDSKIGLVEVIDPSRVVSKDKIVFGAYVTLLDTENESEVTYQIVGDDESDITLGKISISSPIGSSLVGKMIDTLVQVKTPKGIREFEITNIEYK